MSTPIHGGDALIHLRVHKERKAAWVMRSRAEGMKLTDWIVERVERELPTADAPQASDDDAPATDARA